MASWYRTRQGDLTLRAIGALLCAISYKALTALVAAEAVAAHRSVGAVALSLAAVGFLSASAGCAMLLLGRHLLDRIEVSARWRVSADASWRVSSDDQA